VLILWLVGLLLSDSHGKTKLLGFVVMGPIVAVELLSYGFSLVGGSIYDAAPVLKAAMLLPFVWLPFESAKKTERRAGTAVLLRPPATSPALDVAAAHDPAIEGVRS
jgi:hypothetical protein